MATGKGARLGGLTAHNPKAFLEIKGINEKVF
jgi:choline kinase